MFDIDKLCYERYLPSSLFVGIKVDIYTRLLLYCFYERNFKSIYNLTEEKKNKFSIRVYIRYELSNAAAAEREKTNSPPLTSGYAHLGFYTSTHKKKRNIHTARARVVSSLIHEIRRTQFVSVLSLPLDAHGEMTWWLYTYIQRRANIILRINEDVNSRVIFDVEELNLLVYVWLNCLSFKSRVFFFISSLDNFSILYKSNSNSLIIEYISGIFFIIRIYTALFFYSE